MKLGTPKTLAQAIAHGLNESLIGHGSYTEDSRDVEIILEHVKDFIRNAAMAPMFNTKTSREESLLWDLLNRIGTPKDTS